MYKFRQPIESLAPLEDFEAGSGVDYREFQAATKGLHWLSKDDRDAYSQELSQLQERHSRLVAELAQQKGQNSGPEKTQPADPRPEAAAPSVNPA